MSCPASRSRSASGSTVPSAPPPARRGSTTYRRVIIRCEKQATLPLAIIVEIGVTVARLTLGQLVWVRILDPKRDLYATKICSVISCPRPILDPVRQSRASFRLHDVAGKNTRWRFVLVFACTHTPAPGSIAVCRCRLFTRHKHAPTNPNRIIYSSSFSCLRAFLIKTLFLLPCLISLDTEKRTPIEGDWGEL